MERYVNKNRNNNRKSISSRIKDALSSRKKISTLKEEIYELELQSKDLFSPEGYTRNSFDKNDDIKEKIALKEKELNKELKKVKHLKKVAGRVAAIVALTAVTITGGIGLHSYVSNQDFYNDFTNSIETISVDSSFSEKYNNISFDEAKNSPETITALALDTLKAKLAKELCIENPADLTINHTFTDSKNTSTCFINGLEENIDISYKNKKLADHYKYTSYSDSEGVSAKGNFPKALLEAIEKISSAQENSNDIKIAKEALELVDSFSATDNKNSSFIKDCLQKIATIQQEDMEK